ncbi:hypothetical protein BJF93_08795 [Xaviernesmea oryzae]|uniref:Uncharacterized protein n=1 Tax=Xaviernesmea oryzae TaxID=464029 RepID=A0A1Q9B139_9HYPH|nr:hypothetical protein [Xaviernesmea oryzae]OLP61687.1 hypothetical protein BJF93_08795 [Xaviernesmea oryzae]SEL02517.1 hypothetical protein SAMN04487976_105165 [Xaviernesmea oryzae]
MKVVLSPFAIDYVRREAKYLRAGSRKAAQQFADDLKRLRQSLSMFPEIGKRTDEILIFAIRHGRERPPGFVIEDDFDFEDTDRR